MFPPRSSVVLIAALLHGAAFAQAVPAAGPAPAIAATPAQAAMAARIEAAVAPSYRAGEPGVAVIVTQDGKTVFRKAFGEADVATHAPLWPRMAFGIGSMTKQFTATAVMLLAADGKLSVDDDITRFLPDYPTGGKKITIHNLLTHTSGIYNYTDRKDFPSTMGQPVTLDALIGSFRNEPLVFEPGTRYRYSNSNYVLLGAIIEKVAGMPYERFVEQRILVPLKLDDTYFEGAPRGKAERAAGHSRDVTGFVPARPMDPQRLYAAGGLVSTVDDLARWDAAISAGKLLGAAGWQKMFTPAKLNDGTTIEYGYGFQISPFEGVQVIRHAGTRSGYSTMALRVPEQKLYVAVLANIDGGTIPIPNVAQRILLAALDREKPVAQAVTLDPKVFDRYVGTYRIVNPPLPIRISRQGDRYLASLPGQPDYEMKALDEKRFRVDAAAVDLLFGEVDGVIRITIRQAGHEMQAMRVD